MAKVGLKETLALLAAGYKKKDIEALAAMDEQEEQKEQEEKKDPKPDPIPVQENNEQESQPDYKQLYEDLLKKNQETEAKVTKLQQDNVHEDSAPAAAEAKVKEAEALTDLVRSFM